MSASRLVAITLIFVIAAAAWFVLGGSVVYRTESSDEALGGEVGSLWGEQQSQSVPVFSQVVPKGPDKPLELAGSDVSARFRLDQRRKGLLWYSTYVVDFAAKYLVVNDAGRDVDAVMHFDFPTPEGAYDGFAVRIDGKDAKVTYSQGQAQVRFPMERDGRVTVRTGYSTNGLDEWVYQPAPDGVGVIRDFTLTMDTDFGGYDFPDGGVSPTSKQRIDGGERLTWRYDSLVSGRAIGIVMPKPANPGPIAARITFFAPVSLLFFFAALVLLTATSGVRLHPMHYTFLAAAFFAFHLLFAYLVDRIDINAAFAIASVTSVALVIGYLWVVVGRNRSLVEIAVSQLVFLVLFSYSFFFEGFTGLAVTIGSVLTLAYFMAKTAKVDWEQVFVKRERPFPAAPAPPAPPA